MDFLLVQTSKYKLLESALDLPLVSIEHLVRSQRKLQFWLAQEEAIIFYSQDLTYINAMESLIRKYSQCCKLHKFVTSSEIKLSQVLLSLIKLVKLGQVDIGIEMLKSVKREVLTALLLGPILTLKQIFWSNPEGHSIK